MSPLPKIVGYLAALAAIVVAADHAALVSLLGEALTNIIVSVAVVIVGLAHSFTGTGGTAPTTDPTANKGLTANLTTR